jgi:hypothetical protein
VLFRSVIAVPLLIVGVYAAVRWSIIGVLFLVAFFGTWLAFGLAFVVYAFWRHIPEGNYFTAAFLIAFGCFMLAPMVQMISHTLRKRR